MRPQIDGGYAPKAKKTLRTAALRAELSKTGRRQQVRIIGTRRIGICPKKAERILTIAKRTPATEALLRLMDDAPSPEKVPYPKPRLPQGDLVEVLRGWLMLRWRCAKAKVFPFRRVEQRGCLGARRPRFPCPLKSRSHPITILSYCHMAI
jgi:hypothetical protein